MSAQRQGHLWGHFSNLTTNDASAKAVITHGERCWVYDSNGRRYLDGLAGLFCVQVGHGRGRIADAMSVQARELGYFPLWSYAHPPAIELSNRLVGLAGDPFARVFFTSGGSEAVESALKLARQWHRLNNNPGRYKAITRHLSYHGTTLGALALTGLPTYRAPFEPLVGGIHVENTNRYRCGFCAKQDACSLECANDIERAIVREGPETVAAVVLEPVQNAGGCFTPPDGYFDQVREICDRYEVLLISDEVICAFGRLGEYFGFQRLGYQPDLVTFAKGITSGYAPLGGVLASKRIVEPFERDDEVFTHGLTFGGHPVSCAAALANLDIMHEEDLPGRVRRLEGEFRSTLEDLYDLPIVGDVRGMGYFWGIELVKDRDSRQSFDATHLLREQLSPGLFDARLICRTDDRGEPVIQLSPPLIAGLSEFTHIAGAIRTALIDMMAHLEP
jgi:adenosylmethionine-8-amino-7-oxononanoate aminotransferase